MNMIRTIIQDKGLVSALAFKKALFKKKTGRDFLAVVGSELALRPVQFLKGFVVAKYLGPADYGILKAVELIQMMNKYGTLGFRPAAAREIGNAIGKDDKEKANLVRNTAYSSEIILSVALFCLGLLISLFFESTTSILIILASSGLLAAKLRAILNTEATVQRKFILISKISFITSLIASIVIIITVPFYKIYAVILMSFLTNILAIAFYLKTLKYKYSFKIDKKEFKRILGISIPLMAGTLSLGSLKYAERLIVMGMLGTVALGFYGFAFMIINQFAVLFKTAIRVRTQDIYEAIGRKEFLKVHKMVFKETGLLVFGTVLVIPIIWILLDGLIPLILPKWADAILVAQLSLFVLPFLVIHNYANVVLKSSLVNRQKQIPAFQFLYTIILILCAYTLKYFDQMTLENFIIINILEYGIFSLTILQLYKKHFYKVYIKV